VSGRVAPADVFRARIASTQDDAWATKQRQGRESDAILSCPCCLETLCLDCQKCGCVAHAKRRRRRGCAHCSRLHAPGTRATKVSSGRCSCATAASTAQSGCAPSPRCVVRLFACAAAQRRRGSRGAAHTQGGAGGAAGRGAAAAGGAAAQAPGQQLPRGADADELFFSVHCGTCDTQARRLRLVQAPALHTRVGVADASGGAQVGVFDDEEVYHFFNVVATTA
jgi:hypothetical protein